jgi:nucleotide-binding universal stress UspA family protein
MKQVREFAESLDPPEPGLGKRGTQFKTIVVGVDVSEPAATALHAAKFFANQFGSTLFLAYAVPAVLHGPGATPELLEADLSTARAQMEVISSQANLGSIPRHSVIEFAEPTDLIDSIVRAQNADLVVAASHGPHGLEKLAFGSGAESLLRKVCCPVLVVGPHCRQDFGAIRSIVFCSALGIRALRPAQYAVAIAEQVNARLTLLHVRKALPKAIENSSAGDDLLLAQRLQDLLPADAELQGHPNIRVEVGNASEEILRVADEEAADLIVVGAREESTLADRSPWSTVSQVIRGATCPVLGVRNHLD